jgi:hypothetical protein
MDTCDACGRESDDLKSRVLIHDWKSSILAGRDPVERERLCGRCRTIERVKTVIGLGLLLALAGAMIVATIMII